jgi:hypothetical protein
MRTVVERLAAAICLTLCALAPSQALAGYREETHATSIEIAQLPRFCLAQFEVPGAGGDEFKISRDCGDFTNHYCPGLIYFIRGKMSGTKAKALPLIGIADNDVAYTERGIANYPRCPIREHVEATRAEINHLLRLWGRQPVGVK